MDDNFVFSYAENKEGRMVHVDTVPRGLNCNCFCPHCHEPLLARCGDERAHHFAHHSKNRGANLKICYMVILYKLAEQIVQTKKRIHAPSYFGIYEERDIEFIDVKTDSNYEREDKQPDVIAQTKDGKQYLIEFTFEYKVQHKKAIDYKSLNCLEIDLSNQTLDSLEDFLLSNSESRKWLNNESFFKQIEETYKEKGIQINVVSESRCKQCGLKESCCAITANDSISPIIIENGGEIYRLCDIKAYEDKIADLKLLEERRRKEELEWKKKMKQMQEQLQAKKNEYLKQPKETSIHPIFQIEPEETNERTCLNCQNNLSWASKGKPYAVCGIYKTLGISKNNNPEYAERCRGFKQNK